MTKPKVLSTKERTVNTYAHMWHTSFCLLKQGQEKPKGSRHQFMASIVFTAFTLEAYLNHVGKKLSDKESFTSWGKFERLPIKKKLTKITKYLTIKIDNDIRPWSITKNLFKFRNNIAHGKSEVIKEKKEISFLEYDQPNIPGMIPTEWEKYCTLENAEIAREDVEEIIRTIHNTAKAAGFKDNEPFVMGFQSGKKTVIEE